MTSPDIAIPSRPRSPADDTILPFEVAALDLRGRVVRLGPAVDEILARHDYPAAGRQAAGRGDRARRSCSARRSSSRAGSSCRPRPTARCACWWSISPRPAACAPARDSTPTRVAAAIAAGKPTPGALLGHGHLAMTIDQGADMSRYQGLVALEGGNLEDAAHEYFLRSEQIPTRVRLAVAEEFRAGDGGAQPSLARRRHPAAVPAQGARTRAPAPISIPATRRKASCSTRLPEDEAWVEGRSLVETVEDIELIDPAVSSERLLYRLFHERGVRVFRNEPVHAQCSCSRESVEAMLRSFPQEDRDDMVENGMISVTCEFCSANYVFSPGEVDGD